MNGPGANSRLRRIDQAAGRLYARLVAVFCALVCLAMLASAVYYWIAGVAAGSAIGLLGAGVFGLIARASWRSRRGLSDLDLMA